MLQTPETSSQLTKQVEKPHQEVQEIRASQASLQKENWEIKLQVTTIHHTLRILKDVVGQQTGAPMRAGDRT